jgi:hypothetical protein
MKIRFTPFRFALALGMVAVVLYLASFVLFFELTGSPVRNNERGWLGPPIRGHSYLVDIGKVWYYEGNQYSLYNTYRPLCHIWLYINGFPL